MTSDRNPRTYSTAGSHSSHSTFRGEFAITANSPDPSVPERSPTDTERGRPWLWFFLLALSVRLVFVFIAPNNTTDAMSRFEYALNWLRNPGQLPAASASDAWLPLHFWLLGSVLWLWHSEWCARLLTVFFGALTVLPFWGIVHRAFGRRVALASTLLFAIFGFHVAYSVTTSVEVPTILFWTSGIYFWMRFYSERRWTWCFVAAAAFSAACLCRFDPWVSIPVLGLLLLSFPKDWKSVGPNRGAWGRMIGFGLTASLGAAGWMAFSYIKWGDPMELPHRTMHLIHSFAPVLRHSLSFRLVVVPVSLLVSLSPLILGLAVVGIFWALKHGEPPACRLAILAIAMFAFNYFNAVKNETTQARYTLLYSWLLIPFAFVGLRALAERWPWLNTRKAYALTVGFFLFWQGLIIVGGQYGPPAVADKLGPMSPALPLHLEIRKLTGWIKHNVSNSDAVIFDEFNYESHAIIRFAGVDPARTFRVSGPEYSDRSKRDVLGGQLRDFIRLRHPRFAVCSPYGPIGGMWSIDGRKDVTPAAVDISLHLQWQGEHWRVYRIDYPSEKNTATGSVE